MIRWPRRSFARPVAQCDFVFGWVLSVIRMEAFAGQAARAVRAAVTLLLPSNDTVRACGAFV